MPKCDVPGCKDKATWRCEAGFRYCDKHKKPHGSRDRNDRMETHKFVRIK